MQAALCCAQSYSFPSVTTTNTSSSRLLTPPSKVEMRMTLLYRHASTTTTRLMATPIDNSTVDYSSSATSVFPAEACETIGGEACNAEIFPETKLKPEDKSTKVKTTEESVDREYLEYTESKTVFPAEACDDLGGEFCQPEYQKGVY